MPITREETAAPGRHIPTPFVGPVEHTVAVPVNLTQMTTGEIDQFGYLKPGIPLTKAGAKIGAATAVFGVTADYIQVAADNAAGTIAALGTVDIAVATICQVNQDVAEDILDRAYTANELAGFGLAGSHIVLL
jgi:hypothetical protein